MIFPARKADFASNANRDIEERQITNSMQMNYGHQINTRDPGD